MSAIANGAMRGKWREGRSGDGGRGVEMKGDAAGAMIVEQAEDA